jgi:hypothetical protein
MKRRRNPSAAGAIVAGAAPLIPYVVLAGVAWWLWAKWKASPLGGAVAHAASAVPDAYGQAARTAMDPATWRPVYNAAEQQWQAEGEQGNPIAQPYYGPAGEWK